MLLFEYFFIIYFFADYVGLFNFFDTGGWFWGVIVKDICPRSYFLITLIEVEGSIFIDTGMFYWI